MPRVDLCVPFAEKDEAKKLGARWDAAHKVWFVPDGFATAPFARWLPATDDDTADVRITVRPRLTHQSCGMIPIYRKIFLAPDVLHRHERSPIAFGKMIVFSCFRFPRKIRIAFWQAGRRGKANTSL